MSVKNTAANPVPCIVLSEWNSIRSALPSDVAVGGMAVPQYVPMRFNRFSLSFEYTVTESYPQSICCWVLPSRSKCVKFNDILCFGGAIISQMHSFNTGYVSGKDGELIVPFGYSITPPHASTINAILVVNEVLIIKKGASHHSSS